MIAQSLTLQGNRTSTRRPKEKVFQRTLATLSSNFVTLERTALWSSNARLLHDAGRDETEEGREDEKESLRRIVSAINEADGRSQHNFLARCLLLVLFRHCYERYIAHIRSQRPKNTSKNRLRYVKLGRSVDHAKAELMRALRIERGDVEKFLARSTHYYTLVVKGGPGLLSVLPETLKDV